MQDAVEEEGDTKKDKIGQDDHRNTADQIDEHQCKAAAESAFQHTHDTDDQTDDAGKKQPVQRKEQRLPHGGDQESSVFVKNISQRNPAPFRYRDLRTD